MAAATKVPNYTAEQTAELVAGYTADKSRATVEAFAAKFGKNVKSIIAKLSKEGVYVAKVYTTKTGEPSIKKDAHADAIGLIANLTEAETESLTKANKTALVKIMAVFQRAAETPGAVDAVTAAAVNSVETE
jgi:hypothetical protein